MRNLYEFARNSGKEKTESSSVKKIERAALEITEEPLQDILVLAGTPLN